MSTADLRETPLRSAIRHELQAIRGKWIWLVVLGVSLILLGTILLGSPVIATLATVTTLGPPDFTPDTFWKSLRQPSPWTGNLVVRSKSLTAPCPVCGRCA